MKNSISVIMVVKNGESYLAQAIESVLVQSIVPREILLIDGNSKDATPEIASRYPNVTYFLQPGNGLANARNYGISLASGEWILFLDCDDYWAPDKLPLQMEFHRSNSLYEFSIGRVKFFLESGAVLRPGFQAHFFESGTVGYTPGTLCVRHSAFERVGLFDESLDIACDADWFARIKDNDEKVGILENILLHKRIHSNNLSGKIQQNRHELMIVLNRSLKRKRQK
ncbi:MAG: hypothetical protein APR62_08415 [Smithella sp. SDB]|nr:MAG: hypothetical protein APR62_08415 [Smithella sp. SDB]